MSDSSVKQWQRVCGRLHEEIGDALYRNWIQPLQLTAIHEGVVRLEVPTAFIRDWINNHYAARIQALWNTEDPDIRAIQVVVAGAAATPSRKRPPMPRQPAGSTAGVSLAAAPVPGSLAAGSQAAGRLSLRASPPLPPSPLAPASPGSAAPRGRPRLQVRPAGLEELSPETSLPADGFQGNSPASDSPYDTAGSLCDDLRDDGLDEQQMSLFGDLPSVLVARDIPAFTPFSPMAPGSLSPVDELYQEAARMDRESPWGLEATDAALYEAAASAPRADDPAGDEACLPPSFIAGAGNRMIARAITADSAAADFQTPGRDLPEQEAPFAGHARKTVARRGTAAPAVAGFGAADTDMDETAREMEPAPQAGPQAGIYLQAGTESGLAASGLDLDFSAPAPSFSAPPFPVRDLSNPGLTGTVSFPENSTPQLPPLASARSSASRVAAPMLMPGRNGRPPALAPLPPLPASPAAGAGDRSLSAALDPRYTFENFVTGKPNEFAYAAAQRVADSDSVAFNPLFLYGGVGLGKTHLMHAIAWGLQERHPHRRVIYMSAEKFMYTFVRALRDKTTMDFKEQFRTIDVLMIDDVQFICGKDSTQEEFFHTFNSLVDQGRQIVISADKSPADLEDIGDRLRSRLASGLVADIHPTTYELRLGILAAKAELMGVLVPEKVLEFLAHRVTSNVRELEGALTRLVAHAELVGRALTLETAQEILRDVLRANDRRLTIEDIQKKVAEHFQIRLADMASTRRSRAIARPRQVAMFLSKQLTSRSLPEIGRKFGGRDHTTVMHAVKKVEELITCDPTFAEDIDLLRRMLED